ncbi:hypothetical protein CFC21_089914 [Triticum aestivum]|uniref:F-box domain-containing protein n=2 Tax=Triticum aestivum TaxID=4565 RepID=A0A9R1IMY8_WHEAT|nr:hypothetical protein CFC21_089914 [Triticum aestivum]
MSERLDDEESMETAVAGGEDRLGALLDELLLHVMSFLASREAVRTCVLARRWGTLWKSVPALRIDDPDTCHGTKGSSTFVNNLLRLRDPVPLNVCDISSHSWGMDWSGKTFRRIIEPWVQHAASCQAWALQISFVCHAANMTLVSSHLKRLRFSRMTFCGGSLDLSSCRVLEELKMSGCDIVVDAILCLSLQHLNIHDGCFGSDYRTRISAPNLISLKLTAMEGLSPLLDGMPSLVASIFTPEEIDDECDSDDGSRETEGACDCDDGSCGACVM